MISIINKYKELIMYLIFGVLTTLVNIVVYALCTRGLSLDIYISNVIAWILSVLFAYSTNRRYVFNSKVKLLSEKIKEITSFYGCRLFTFGVDMVLMFILIDVIFVDDMLSKIVVNVIVIVLNYILSKFLIFKK